MNTTAHDEEARRSSGVARDPCAPCGLCCRSYLVPVYGHDVWRIATRRGRRPESFLFACEQEKVDSAGFRLEPGGATYALALGKKERLEATQPCIFLAELEGGESRCGIYPDRPVACASYPMSKWANQVFRKPTALCPPEAWPEDEASRPSWHDSLQRLRMERDVYAEVIGRWDARVDAEPQGTRLKPAELFDYILSVYDRLADLETEIGEAALSTIRTKGSTRDDGSGDREGEPAWIDYLRRVRKIIDQFFPGVPPQPFRRVTIEAEL